jgi:hypothetical protein
MNRNLISKRNRYIKWLGLAIVLGGTLASLPRSPHPSDGQTCPKCCVLGSGITSAVDSCVYSHATRSDATPTDLP